MTTNGTARALKAWATRRANEQRKADYRARALKAWVTIRGKAARKAWVTRRAKIAAAAVRLPTAEA